MPSNDNILDRTILSLSDSDPLRLRDLVEGTLITGAPGSGKSSTSGKQLGCGLLRARNSGGLVLTAKALGLAAIPGIPLWLRRQHS